MHFELWVPCSAVRRMHFAKKAFFLLCSALTLSLAPPQFRTHSTSEVKMFDVRDVSQKWLIYLAVFTRVSGNSPTSASFSENAMFSSIYSTLSGALGSSSVPSSTPSTPPPSQIETTSSSSSQLAATPLEAQDTEPEDSLPTAEQISASSAFYRKLVERNKHSSERLLKIRQEAVKEKPPKEPSPEECCGEACGLECVTTVW